MQVHQSFRHLRHQSIDSLGIEISEFEHSGTGARHYHIHADQAEKVFLVALRTMPQDSTGVAHILEHTALCGSERYPVRDPFFMMTRRSLNTFMNAFTSSDWTAYPFASQNHKDFYNLLDVYLDAVFFSRLDPLDFAQEGHRVEFADSGNPDSELVYKGVVYNEMKGAMSSPVSTLWQTLTRYLFPETTYHHNSGGEPASIPDLSYEQLRDFYRSHYHPSNAIFMTFGDLDLHELQEKLHQQALSRFQRSDICLSVPDEKRYFAPLRVEEAYALDEPSLDNKTHHVLGWLLSHSIDIEAMLEAHLLSRVLLDNSSSPLRAALESCGLGSAPSPLCGLEDSNREMSFMCGIEGSEPERAQAFEALVLETLQRVVDEGVDQRMVEAQLHQLELSQREITGDGYPFGLQLILSCLPAAIHRGDPLGALNIDPVLAQLRKKVADPAYIPGLVQRLLLDNPHRVRVTLRPDAQLSERRDAAEAARLAALKAQLSAEDVQKVIEQTQALELRQQQVDDDEILPCVTLEDVPLDLKLPEADKLLPELDATWYSAGTNGLNYQQVIVELPRLDEAACRLLPLYSYCLTELGCGERDYRANQALQSEITGGFSAYTSIRGSVEDEQRVSGYLVLSAKALDRHHAAVTELMAETLQQARFDELTRLREIVAQQRSRREQSVTGRGHALAMAAASAGFSPAARLSHQTTGLESIRWIKTLDKALEEPAALTALSEDLTRLHVQLRESPRRFLTVAEADLKLQCAEQLQRVWQTQPVKESMPVFALPPTREAVRQLWITSTQVNFCAMAFPTVTADHEDAAALTVLGDFLRNGYLHRAIREQGGAYGAGAGQDNGDAVFRFFSYRDPRSSETLEDFLKARDWLLTQEHDPKKLQEAILGVISSIDKPGSPAGEAKQTYHAALFGRTPEHRRAFRSRVLSVTLNDMKRAAERWLDERHASVALVTSSRTADKLDADYQRIEL